MAESKAFLCVCVCVCDCVFVCVLFQCYAVFGFMHFTDRFIVNVYIVIFGCVIAQRFVCVFNIVMCMH